MGNINDQFGGKVRVRVCGICIEEDKILLVKHKGFGEAGELWIPPGGGVELGDTIEATLIREFYEECGIKVSVKKLLVLNEYINSPIHAIELFFEVNRVDGKVSKGYDPELLEKDQIIEEVRFVTFDELNRLPENKRHDILKGKISKNGLLNMNGYFKLSQ